MIKAVVVRAIILAFVVFAVSAFLIDWNALVRPGGRRDTEDASLQGDQIRLAARVAGNLVSVPVRDYGRVHAGEVLFAIDDEDYRARVAIAEAAVASAQAAVTESSAKLTLQGAEIAAARAEVVGAESDLDRAHLERLRQDALVDTESFLRRNWEGARASEAQQAAALSGQRHAVVAATTQVNVLRAQLTASEQALKNAEANLALARIDLGHTRIVAPVDGIVTSRLARLGEYVAPGRLLITLVPLTPIWAVANYREVELTRIRPGQHAEITVDSLPGIRLHGHVDSIEPQSQASASRLPPDRATGNFTKIIQRVPVKITLDPRPDLLGLLRPGLSVEAYVYTSGVAP